MTSINLQSCGSRKTDTNLARIQLNCCGDGSCDHSGTCAKCEDHDGGAGCKHPDGEGTCERPSFLTNDEAVTACKSKCREENCNITSIDNKFYFTCTK